MDSRLNIVPACIDRLNGQASLANAAGANQGQQLAVGVGDQPQYFSYILFPTNKRGWLRWQIMHIR